MTTKPKTQDKHKMSEIDENISKLFDIKKRLGKGAYGIVWKAMDKRTNETLAVKKIFDAFRDETDAQRTFREIIFLKAFRNHPNVIKLHNVYKASNNLDIYLIFEYMESDLHNIIKKGSILKDIHKRYVMYQLINAIKYIHSGNVIHRDLKPSNVLIDSKCRCKLADFGLARSVSNRPLRDSNDVSETVIEPLLTDYVATRWYRAPEILVASKRYTKGIDMWSLGCILGEMIRGKPLFQGTSTINQIEKIVTALPEITERDINAVGAGFGSVLLSKQISRERKTSLDELLCEAPDDAVHLVKSLLLLDPLGRLTAKQALAHVYVEKFRNSIPEMELNVDILPPFRDDVRLSVPEYRSKLYEIVQTTAERANAQRQNMTNNKNGMCSNKYKEHKPQSGYDKLESKTFKQSTKIKPSYSEEKHYSKDKLLIRPEKHELETTQHSMGVPHIINKALKKMSPISKRKSSHSKTMKQHMPMDVPEKALQQHEQPHIVIPRSKAVHSKPGHEPLEEALRATYVFDKRHSIDCGYGSLPDGYVRQPSTPNGALKKIDSSHKLYKSSSSLHREKTADRLTPHLRQQQQQQHNNRAPPQAESVYVQHVPHIEPNERLNRSTPVVTSYDGKPAYVRNSKSDMIPADRGGGGGGTEKTNDRICYEQRLRKLEQEIEKYKKEVKTFCKESCRYKQQKSHETPTRSGPPPMAALQKSSKKHHLPPVTPHNTPKENPYYKLLSKGNRDFGKTDFELCYMTTGGGGGSGDHIGRAYSNSHAASNEGVASGGIDGILYSEQQLHAFRKQQHDYTNHHQQQQQQQQQRIKPLSKFI